MMGTDPFTIKDIGYGIDLCEVLRKRLRERTYAGQGFSLLRNKLNLSRKDIEFMIIALPPDVLIYLHAKPGMTLNSIKTDHWQIASRVKNLSKELKSLYSANKFTKELIQDVVPKLNEIATFLDSRHWGMDTSIDRDLYWTLKKTSTSNNARTFVIRQIYSQVLSALNEPRREAMLRGVAPHQWPALVILEHPPVKAIAFIATALMDPCKLIHPSTVSEALKLKIYR